MVLRIPNPKSGMSYSQLIEESAHLYLPIKPIPYTSYIPEHEVLSELGISSESLRRRLIHSKSMHALELPTGALLIHPIGFLRYISRFYIKMLSSIQQDMSGRSGAVRKIPENVH